MDKSERRQDNIELDHEISELELELGMKLDEFDVEFPGESELRMTIDAMRIYVPTKQNKWETIIPGVSQVLRHATKEVYYFSPLFWASNLLFLLIGILTVFIHGLSPYAMALVLAPIPTIIGLVEVFKNGNKEMAELEMSLKFSLQEIIISRMIVVGGFNLALNFLLTISLAILQPEVIIGKMILYWVTPFTVISALMLVVATWFRQLYILTGGLVLWIAFGSVLTQQDMLARIESIPAGVYLLITMAAGIFALGKMINIYKRGISYEFNN